MQVYEVNWQELHSIVTFMDNNSYILKYYYIESLTRVWFHREMG